MAVTEAKVQRNGKRPTSRDEAAELIETVLTEEPQSEAQIRRQLGVGTGRSELFRSGFAVLEARHKAKKIPAAPGKRSGWVAFSSELEAPEVPGEAIQFPYEWALLSVDDMFIDPDYQRPLTSFVDKIRKNFNPVLFQTLVVNRRERANKDGRSLAIIDGQTRWRAAERRGIKEVPSILFTNLTPAQEAEMFALLQKERKAILSLHRFRAQIAAKNPESLAIAKIAKSAGWKIGAEEGGLRAVAALEWGFRSDPELLERTLAVLMEAWPPNRVPEDKYIRGLHFFYRHYPLGERVQKEVNDDKLVTRLIATGVDGLDRKAIAVKEHLGRKTQATLIAHAIQAVYGKR